MIELMSDLPDGVTGLRYSGEVSRDDYTNVALPALRASIQGDAPIRMMVVIDDDFEEFEGGSIWEDMKFGASAISHHSKWERTALVSDVDWIRRATGLFGWMMPGEFKMFRLAELDDAKTWLAG
jgi:hypothetical protein